MSRVPAHIRLFFVCLSFRPVASFQLLRRGTLQRPWGVLAESAHPSCRVQEGRWKRVVFVRAGLQGRMDRRCQLQVAPRQPGKFWAVPHRSSSLAIDALCSV